MADDIEVTIEQPTETDAQAQAAATVEVAQIMADSIEQRVDALAAATATLHDRAHDITALREAFDAHVRGNESDFTLIMQRLDALETGLALMREALETEASVVEDLLREEIREELAHEAAIETHEHGGDHEEVIEALETGEVPASVEDAEAVEPSPPSVEESKKRKRHFLSLGFKA